MRRPIIKKETSNIVPKIAIPILICKNAEFAKLYTKNLFTKIRNSSTVSKFGKTALVFSLPHDKDDLGGFGRR